MKNIGTLLLCSTVLLLAGCGGKNVPTPPSVNADTYQEATETVYKEIALGHDGRNTVPQVTTLPAGENYKFVITPEKNGEGCMSTIKWAGTTVGDTRLVEAGKPIAFTINEAQPGEYFFVCNGMDMEQGKVVIEA